MIKPDILIRTKRRTMSLTINREGKLVVRAPENIELNDIFNFIKRKESWIRKKQSTVVNILEANQKIINFEQTLFLGKLYEVVYIKGLAKICLQNNYLCLPSKIKPEKAGNAIKKWLYNMCEEVILDRVDYFAELMGIEFSGISFISSRAKWGSCDSNYKLSFNFKMLMLPPKIIDYIIIHELAHVLELNHSSAFWEIVGSMLPTYKKQRETLQSSGFLLNLFLNQPKKTGFYQ